MENKKKIPEIRSLRYKKGELIVKEGDYGVSIYKIIKGKVQILRELGEREVILATLRPGEIIGEMTFLSGPNVPRSASAKALEDSELEVWHFSTLRKEYEEMTPILKSMATQCFERLIRMNNILVNLDGKRREAEKLKRMVPGASQRRFYRKEVDLDCIYRPGNSSPKVCLKGRIKDISLSGIGLEVSAKNGSISYHKPGEVFVISTVLPNGKDLDLKAKVTSVSNNDVPGKLFLGMCFSNMPAWVRKRLGFFLLP